MSSAPFAAWLTLSKLTCLLERGYRLVSREVSKKKVQNKLNWVRRRLAKAEAELLALRQARERDGAHRLTSEFVAKVALAAPSASERSFADAWADLIGAGAAGCSRRTIWARARCVQRRCE